MKRYFLIVLLIAVVCLKADEKNKNNDTFTREYLPYSEKVVLVYSSNFDEAVSKTDRNNNTVTLENKADNFTYRQKYELMDDGLYITETYQKVKVLLFFKKEKLVTYNKRLLKVPFPVKTGQTWSCERMEYCDDDSNKISLQSKCVGMEEITVPAGKFTGMKLETKVKSDDGSTNLIEEWIVPNIGLVKVRAKMDGGGLTGTIRDLLGLSELNFELKEIRSR